MKIQITRIGLMTLALVTSLTAVGQVTDQKLKKTDALRFERGTQQQTGLYLSLKDGNGPDTGSAKDLKDERPSRQDQQDLRLDHNSFEKSHDGTPNLLIEGGVNAGGGSFVTIDGQIVLSDSLYKKIGKVQTFEKAFPTELQIYIESTLYLLHTYGIVSFDFFTKFVSSKDSLYAFVTEEEFKSVPCDHYLPKLTRPVEKHVQFGCSKGNVTYLVFKGDFEVAPLIEQARAVIHERLWVANPNVDQRFIADFTNALKWLKSRQEGQVFRHKFSRLTEEEMEMFNDLEVAARQLGFPTQDFSYAIKDLVSWDHESMSALIKSLMPALEDKNISLRDLVVQNGGGIKLSNAKIDERSFVGVGAVIAGGVKDVQIQNSTILNSQVVNATVLNSSISESVIGSLTMESSNIQKSRLTGEGTAGKSQGFKIQFVDFIESRASGYSLLGKEDARILVQASELYGSIYGHTSFSGKTKFSAGGTVEAGSTIVMSKLHITGSIGTNVHLTKMNYWQLSGERDEDSCCHSPYTEDFDHLKIASDSNVQNLTYVFKYKPSVLKALVGRYNFELNSRGQVLDFNGLKCVSTDTNVVIHNAQDLLATCK